MTQGGGPKFGETWWRNTWTLPYVWQCFSWNSSSEGSKIAIAVGQFVTLIFNCCCTFSKTYSSNRMLFDHIILNHLWLTAVRNGAQGKSWGEGQPRLSRALVGGISFSLILFLDKCSYFNAKTLKVWSFLHGFCVEGWSFLHGFCVEVWSNLHSFWKLFVIQFKQHWASYG